MKTGGEMRRRGSALEAALLDATWAELQEVGFSNLTFESVAKRASTSRMVLSRRWKSKMALATAAIQHYMARDWIPVANLGSLREDVIATLTAVSDLRGRHARLMLLAMSQYFAETDATMSQLRAPFGPGSRLNEAVDRAIARGEVDASKVTARIVALPMDLLLNELVSMLAPVPAAVIAEIVDDIFLPLIAIDTQGRKRV